MTNTPNPPAEPSQWAMEAANEVSTYCQLHLEDSPPMKCVEVRREVARMIATHCPSQSEEQNRALRDACEDVVGCNMARWSQAAIEKRFAAQRSVVAALALATPEPPTASPDAPTCLHQWDTSDISDIQFGVVFGQRRECKACGMVQTMDNCETRASGGQWRTVVEPTASPEGPVLVWEEESPGDWFATSIAKVEPGRFARWRITRGVQVVNYDVNGSADILEREYVRPFVSLAEAKAWCEARELELKVETVLVWDETFSDWLQARSRMIYDNEHCGPLMWRIIHKTEGHYDIGQSDAALLPEGACQTFDTEGEAKACCEAAERKARASHE